MDDSIYNKAATIIQKYVRRFLIFKRMRNVNKRYQRLLTEFKMNENYTDVLTHSIWRPNNSRSQNLDALKQEFNNLCIETLWLQQAIISRKSFLYFKSQI